MCLDLAKKIDADIEKLAHAETRSHDKITQYKADRVKLNEAALKCVRTAHGSPEGEMVRHLSGTISPEGEVVLR